SRRLIEFAPRRPSATMNQCSRGESMSAVSLLKARPLAATVPFLAGIQLILTTGLGEAQAANAPTKPAVTGSSYVQDLIKTARKYLDESGGGRNPGKAA